MQHLLNKLQRNKFRWVAFIFTKERTKTIVEGVGLSQIEEETSFELGVLWINIRESFKDPIVSYLFLDVNIDTIWYQNLLLQLLRHILCCIRSS